MDLRVSALAFSVDVVRASVRHALTSFCCLFFPFVPFLFSILCFFSVVRVTHRPRNRTPPGERRPSERAVLRPTSPELRPLRGEVAHLALLPRLSGQEEAVFSGDGFPWTAGRRYGLNPRVNRGDFAGIPVRPRAYRRRSRNGCRR